MKIRAERIFVLWIIIIMNASCFINDVQADDVSSFGSVSVKTSSGFLSPSDSLGLFYTDLLPPIRHNDRAAHTFDVLPTEPMRLTRHVQKGRLLVASGVLVTANYYAYRRFENMWWNHPTTKFHFYRGWRQSEGWYDFGPHDSLWHHMDKFGHYYNARLLSLLLSDAAYWVGFQQNQSRWIGAIASWLLYLQIEIFDGQFEQWGFSLGDLAANTAGAFMPVASHHSPFVNKFTLKLSYHPSQDIGREKYMVEDYAGMTFWLTTNPQYFLPHFFDSMWPDFLNIAFGYSITQKAYGDIELFLALDYDLTAIKAHSAFWNKVLYYANYIHLPAPAIKIRPMNQFYLLYF